MNFKELYKVIALTYYARVQSWGEDDDDEVFTYLRDLRNKYKVVLYDDGFMSKLPKIVWA